METGFKKEQLNSNFFKTQIGNDLLHKNYLAVVTEGFNSSDVYGVSSGCNDFAATGINIRQLSKYYNFCAVDPKLIPYGSVVLVKFDTGIEAFLATDCGADIKGNRLDLYFVIDRGNAREFGSRDLEIKVIRS